MCVDFKIKEEETLLLLVSYLYKTNFVAAMHLFLLRLELGDVNRYKFNEEGEQVILFTIGPGELPSLKSRSTTDRLRAAFEQEL